MEEVSGESGRVNILVESAVSAERTPFVKITLQSQTVGISCEAAQELGLYLMNAALTAEQDLFLVEFMQEKVGATERGAGAILGQIREWREKRGTYDRSCKE